MFASRALTGAEKNYQNLERECLVTIRGMEKFHYFLYWPETPSLHIQKTYGGDFAKDTKIDCEELPIPAIWCSVQDRHGNSTGRCIERSHPTPVEEDGIQLPIVAVNLIMSNLPVSSTEIELIHEETSKDPTLTLMRHYIHMGWPIDWRMLPQELHTFWNYREDLSMENGLITKGARLLIPSTLRRKVLEQIHDGHLGIEKCMLKARDSVFWPGISNDIQETGKMWNL